MDQKLYRKIRNARITIINNLLLQALGPDYTEEEALTHLQEKQPIITTNIEGDKQNACPIINFELDARSAFARKKISQKVIMKKLQDKEEKNESYLKRKEIHKIYDAKRSKKEKEVREKLKNGEDICSDDEFVVDRLNYKKTNPKKELTQSRSIEFLQKTVDKICEKNGVFLESHKDEEDIGDMVPASREDIISDLTAFLNVTEAVWHEKKRKYKLSDVYSRKLQDQKTRRKAMKRKAAALRPKKEEEYVEKNLIQKTQLAEYHKQYREKYEQSRKLERSDWYPPYIKRKNFEFGVDMSLDVECDEKAFLKNFFKLPCAFCNQGGDISIDRIDPTKHYFLDNIIPACKTCNFAKNIQQIDEFIERAKKIHIFQKTFQIWMKDICRYCGIKNPSGVDRINSQLTYSEENAVRCCSLCNYMKRDVDFDVFLLLCGKITEVNIENNLYQTSKKKVQNLHNVMQKEYEEKAKLIPRRKQAIQFVSDRDALDLDVIVLKNCSTYHSIQSTCIYKYFDDKETESKYPDTSIKKTSADVALKRGKKPCRLCRKKLSQMEYDYIRSADFVVQRNGRVTSMQKVRNGIPFEKSNYRLHFETTRERSLDSQLWFCEDDPLYHCIESCKTMFKQMKYTESIFESIVNKEFFPCYSCLDYVHSNEKKLTLKIRKTREQIRFKLSKRHSRQQS